MKQYGHMTDIAADRITLQNMEKKPSESFKQYTQLWREVATQVQPPLIEKETTMLFINTLKAPFINHMLGSATKSFLDIVMSGEMIENTIRSGKIDAGESAKKTNPEKEGKRVTVSQLRTVTTSHQGPPRQDSNPKPNMGRIQFTPILMTYRELYQN
ncbi:trans-resveratrol di-O-methyltransferase-like [Gossypium australe]|uniref:Trans-resveratrol di-O-methyltransferase-like n=1 Tax=Gossypium australe TaxID=47621 RepID=A0A5B6VNC9_9ROSI|nr:trans-resveratrol di-O-methyltransferase-like [Gossypium australe]